MLLKPRLHLLKSAAPCDGVFAPLARAGRPVAFVERYVDLDGRTQNVPVRKAQSDDEQIVWGEVYAPDFPDSQGDYMTGPDIKRMAHAFMRKSDMHEIDVQHDQVKSGAFIVESFIAREGDPVFIPGAWVLGVHIPDPVLWEAVKKGDLNGFSLDGYGRREEGELVVTMPEVLTGRTLKSDGLHAEHDFAVRYDTDGRFMGGRTSEAPDGHWHEILRGTCTEPAGDPLHTHRFSYIEGVGRA